LERFVRRREGYRNGSWRYGNAIRQVGEFLIEYGGGGFHQYLGLSQGRLPQSFQNLGEPLAPSPFVMHFIAGRQAFQMRDEFVAVRNDICSHLAGNARPQDLLGSAGTDAQEGLEGLTIHPRPGEVTQLCDDLV